MLTSQQRRWYLLACIPTLVLGLTYFLAVPDSGSIVWGMLRGESFYQGKPASWWARSLTGRGDSPGSAALGQGLLQNDPAALAIWIELTTHKDNRVRTTALFELVRKNNPAALPILIECLKHEDRGARLLAIQGLARLGTKSSDAVLALTRGLRDADDGVREATYQALSTLGPAAKAAVPALKEILNEKPASRSVTSLSATWPPLTAARVILHIAPDDEDALATLVYALHDQAVPDIRLRTVALEALAEMGPHARAAVPGLLHVIRTDGNGNRVEAALMALEKIAPEEAARLELK